MVSTLTIYLFSTATYDSFLSHRPSGVVASSRVFNSTIVVGSILTGCCNHMA